jgi:DNA polymerase-3 subunit alpha
MWQCALDMEGNPRQASTHAGGVVITYDEAFNIMPLQMATGMKQVITQFDMVDLEIIGIGKLDILGLNTLEIIKRATDMIRSRQGMESFDIKKISLDDPDVYQFISDGHTKGIFQMEAPAFTKCVIEIAPKSFQEVADALALFRPGPLGDPSSGEISLKDEYVKRKHGRVTINIGEGEDNPYIRYIHPTMWNILKDTQGIIIYQEQVMRIASELAGLSRTDGYKIIKAISKKKKDQLIPWRQKFVDGAVANGFNREWTEKLWSAIEKFAGYSFNMAHAKSYAVLTYWTAYLSYYYPVEFFCAYLNSTVVSKDAKRKDTYLAECYKRGIPILGPDINESGFDYTPTSSGVRYGLKSIRGIASSATYIVTNRDEFGPYTSYQDFTNRIPAKQINSSMRTTLTKVGAFDSVDPNIRGDMSYSERVDAEMTCLGTTFDLSILPQARFNTGTVTMFIEDAIETGGMVSVVGMITNIMEKKAHNSGNVFVTATIRDETGSVDVVIYSSLYTLIRNQFIKGSIWHLVGEMGQYGTINQVRISRASRLF